MRLKRNKNLYSFSGHETFAFRYPWLPKGVSAIRNDPYAFSKDNVASRLGVGKNMAASIKFWSLATGVIEMDGNKGKLTPIGKLLFGSEEETVFLNTSAPPACHRDENLNASSSDASFTGVDPYIEDLGTLWLLHWQLASTPNLTSTWYLAFTCWNENVFSRDDLLRFLIRWCQTNTRKISQTTLVRDIRVFFRTYLPKYEYQQTSLEDEFDCPLAELGMLRYLGRDLYACERKIRPSLPVEILVYAIIDYWSREISEQETLSIERLIYGPGSPGATFKIDAREFGTMLMNIPTDIGLRYDETAGQRLVMRDSSLTPYTALLKYYGV